MLRLSLAITALTSSACIGKLFQRAVSQQACKTSGTFYDRDIADSIIAQKCEHCHTRDGLASGTRLILIPSNSAQARANNLATLASLAAIEIDGMSLLLAKPSQHVSHGGGEQLPPDSAEFANFTDMVDRLRQCTFDNVAGEDAAVAGAPTFIGARVRRLSNFELTQTVKSILGTQTDAGALVTPDTRQDGFTQNAAQIIDGQYAEKWQGAAEALAAEATQPANLAAVAPCSGDERTCASTFIEARGRQFYRRALTSEERTELLATYDVGRRDYTGLPGSYASGIELVIAAMLQSPAFLFLTELGAPLAAGETRAAGSPLKLDPFETATALAYFLTGNPPDQPLLDAAQTGALDTREQRVAHALRLIELAPARMQIERFAAEWLGIDGIDVITRDATRFPKFTAGFGTALRADAQKRAADAILSQDGSVARLLGDSANYSEPSVASAYGAARPLLTHPAIMTRYAHPDETAPVLRGLFVMRRMLCRTIEPPTNVAGALVPPPPSATATTRERVETQGQQAACTGCHGTINPIGFLFEGFDASGAVQTTDKGKPVNSSGALTLDNEPLTFGSALEAAPVIAAARNTRDCFTRMLFRFASGQADVDTEFSLLDQPEFAQGTLRDSLVNLVASDMFVMRRQQ